MAKGEKWNLMPFLPWAITVVLWAGIFAGGWGILHLFG